MFVNHNKYSFMIPRKSFFANFKKEGNIHGTFHQSWSINLIIIFSDRLQII